MDGCYHSATMNLLKTIEWQVLVYYYYNRNQITRMKIQKEKDKFKPSNKFSLKPEKFIEEVISPFTPKIKEQDINVYIARKNDFSGIKLGLDWELYQLILFNIIQNAVKYNKPKGDIVVLLTCKPQ